MNLQELQIKLQALNGKKARTGGSRDLTREIEFVKGQIKYLTGK